MKKDPKLNAPWLVAVWPGMGMVSISAGYYLMAKLGMHLLAEFPAREFFDLAHIEVKGGLILTERLPRSRLFLWKDPQNKHDLIVFIGEAQPPAKSNAFCSQLINHVRPLGVQQVFTFAAMATNMRPEQPSRVFGAAIDRDCLAQFKRLNLEILEEGKISGLNGVLLGIAADSGMRGGCILGEMPHAFPQFPCPKASLAVLKAFTAMAGISLDFTELEAQSLQVEEGLHQFLQSLAETPEPAEETTTPAAEATEPQISPQDQAQLNELFDIARKDRSRAYELKQALDRLNLFHQYEDRFLDLFKEPH